MSLTRSIGKNTLGGGKKNASRHENLQQVYS